MKTFLFILALAVVAVSAWGDDLTRAVQQKLKDQGFFYGEATGQPGSETDAAIRRYQIRYGLKVTGALNDETMHSLGLKLGDYPPPQNAARHGNETGGNTPAATPRSQSSAPQALPPRVITSPTPRPHAAVPRPTPSPETRQRAQPEAPTYRAPQEPEPDEENPENTPPNQGYNQGPSGPSAGGGYGSPYGGGGSPYGRAPGRAARPGVVAKVQRELARRGYYQGPVDGQLGGATTEAIGRFQASLGMRPTGRLNPRTLVALNVAVRRAYRGYSPYGPYRPYGPYGPAPYGPYGPYPYGPYGPYARNYW
jgi:peptidoglycan hydrolase-like protein with peptidoglycan-binding domain